MKEKKTFKNLPASENGPGVLCNGKFVYIISQDLKKNKFTLWIQTEDGYEKITTADSPIKLYDKVEWF